MHVDARHQRSAAELPDMSRNVIYGRRTVKGYAQEDRDDEEDGHERLDAVGASAACHGDPDVRDEGLCGEEGVLEFAGAARVECVCLLRVLSRELNDESKTRRAGRVAA